MQKCLLLLLACGFLGGCASQPERKPVGPSGSTDSYQPWNAPQPGEGQGAFGGVFNRQ
jgi:hypothetical protein